MCLVSDGWWVVFFKVYRQDGLPLASHFGEEERFLDMHGGERMLIPFMKRINTVISDKYLVRIQYVIHHWLFSGFAV